MSDTIKLNEELINATLRRVLKAEAQLDDAYETVQRDDLSDYARREISLEVEVIQQELDYLNMVLTVARNSKGSGVILFNNASERGQIEGKN